MFGNFKPHQVKHRWMPTAAFNLWRNPFGELTRQERVSLAVISDNEFMHCKIGSSEAIQLIGDCGNGKTTRMLTFHQKLPESSYVYLPEDEPCPDIPSGNPVLIDEAQRLPWRVRRAVFSTNVPLILATHRDLRTVLERYGYKVKTTTIGQHNTPEHIQAILNRRIEASRLEAGPVPQISIEFANALHQSFGNNVRAIEQKLYKEFQKLVIRHAKM